MGGGDQSKGRARVEAAVGGYEGDQSKGRAGVEAAVGGGYEGCQSRSGDSSGRRI